MIDISGLSKAEVLKALYDGSHVQGMGFLQAVPDGYVTVEHCKMLLNNTAYPYFDYLYGRIIKVDLSGDEFDERLYDRDNGLGAAQRAIDKLRGITHKKEYGECFIAANTGIQARVDFLSPDPGFMLRFESAAAVRAMIHACERLLRVMGERE